MVITFYFYFSLAQANKVKTNTNICEDRETTKLVVSHMRIPVILTVNGKATTPVIITLIASVNVIVIEMDLARSVNVTGKVHEAVLTTVDAKAILEGKNIVSVTVRDRVIVVESVTKTVSVIETARDHAAKRDMVIEIKEESLTRLVIREKIHLILNMNQKKGRYNSLGSSLAVVQSL